MSNDTKDPADALAAVDEALVAALRAGDPEAALTWASARNGLLEQIAEQAQSGVVSARALLREARAANDSFERAASADRALLAEEIAAVQAQRRLHERVRPVLRDEPRFVSRRA